MCTLQVLTQQEGTSMTHIRFQRIDVQAVICTADNITTLESHTACAYLCYHTPCCITFSFSESKALNNCLISSDQPETFLKSSKELTDVYIMQGELPLNTYACKTKFSLDQQSGTSTFQESDQIKHDNYTSFHMVNNSVSLSLPPMSKLFCCFLSLVTV